MNDYFTDIHISKTFYNNIIAGYKLFTSKDNDNIFDSATIMENVGPNICVIENSDSGCCIFIHLNAHYNPLKRTKTYFNIEDFIKEWKDRTIQMTLKIK